MDESKRHPPKQLDDDNASPPVHFISASSVSSRQPLYVRDEHFGSKKEVVEFFQNAFRDERVLLESIVDNTPGVIYVKDPAGKYLLINKSFEKLFHIDRQDAKSKTDYDLFPQNMADAFRENDQKVLQFGMPVEFEEVAPHDDGNHTYISLKFPILDTQGKVCAVAGISTDITERKRLEESLKKSTDYLKKIIDAVGDPIFVKDRQHRWVLLNDACWKFMGRRREELIGKSDHEFFPKEQADIFWAKDEEVFKSGQENINEEYFTDAQGVLHTIVTKKTLYLDPSGEKFIVGVIRDMTDQKRAEQGLLQKSFELSKANAEREYLELFACVASHDLQEPLQKIIAFSGLLKAHSAQALDGEGRNFVEKLQAAAMRMSRMIEDLLQFTKVLTGNELFEQVDLKAVADEVVSELDDKISKAQARIEMKNLPVIYADRRQMYLLFLNLITNALKFQKPGTAPHIRLSGHSPEPGFVRIEVADNGVGFEEQYLEKMFQPFERLHGRHEYEGNGIGLAICKKIVMRHGGTITARSPKHQGAVFLVTLPGKSESSVSHENAR